MLSDITTALIGLGGVLVGTASTAVALVIARQNRRLQESLAVANEVNQQMSVMRGERREAYAQFLMALNVFNRAVMAAGQAAQDGDLEEGSPSPGHQLREAMHDLWFRFQVVAL